MCNKALHGIDIKTSLTCILKLHQQLHQHITTTLNYVPTNTRYASTLNPIICNNNEYHTNTNKYVTCVCCNTHIYTIYLYYILRMYVTCSLSACIHLQKARVFTFLKLRNFHPYRPSLPMSHPPATYHCIQSITMYLFLSSHVPYM
jgi:hypothetical protein